MDHFSTDYNLNDITEVTPIGRIFKMLVTERFRSHYAGNSYEEYTSDLLLKYVKDGSLFIDVGAHYGYYSLLIGSGKPSCRIISFEPVPENFEILKRNIELNGLKNITPYQTAVSDKEGKKPFHITDASDNCGFHGHPLSADIKSIEVESIRLDSFLNITDDRDITIKIDTEGHEIYVLQGMEKFLRVHDNVKLIIEFNPKCIINAGYEPSALLEKIVDLGFDIYFILDDKRLFYKLDPTRIDRWPDYLKGYETAYLNIFAIKKAGSLNVCFFSHSSNLLGAENSMAELTKELIDDCHALVTVCMPFNGGLEERLVEAGAAVLPVDYDWWCDWQMPGGDEANKRLVRSYLNVLRTLRDTITLINPDVIVTNTLVIPWGAVTAAMLNKPHAWFVREYGELDYDFKFFRPFAEILKIIDESSNNIFTVSKSVRDVLFPAVDSSRVFPVYTHFEAPSDSDKKSETAYYSRPGALKLAITGTVIPSKGQKDAVLAVKELVGRGRDVELLITGPVDDAYGAELKNIIESNGLAAYVKILGWQEKANPVKEQADIVLMCSRYEAFGRVTAEAMMLKKPVIGTNIGGTVELIRNGFNGFLYEPGNYGQLADKIEYFIENKDRIKIFGENGYRFAKKSFAREKYGARVYGILQELKINVNPVNADFIHFINALNMEALANLEDKLKQQYESIKASEASLDELIRSLLEPKQLLCTLESNLWDRNKRINTLKSILLDTNKRINTLKSILLDTNKRVNTLESGLTEKERNIKRLERRLRIIKDQLNKSENNLGELRWTYSAVINSLTWRSAKGIQKVIDKLLPLNSKRRFLIGRLLAGITKPRQMLTYLRFNNLKYYIKHLISSDIQDFQQTLNRDAAVKADLLFIDPAYKLLDPDRIKGLNKLADIVFDKCEDPLLSIIVSAHNRWQALYTCLAAIKNNFHSSKYEVILLDLDHSSELEQVLKKISGISIVDTVGNNYSSRFNEIQQIIKGKYILFLNEDTFVFPGCIDSLISTIEKDIEIGIVGPKTILPDNKLESAGGMIRKIDAEYDCINIGYLDNKDSYKYNFVKEADYFNNSCFMARKEALQKSGGFKPGYTSDFYACIDLAFTLRETRYKTIYQPDAIVLHWQNQDNKEHATVDTNHGAGSDKDTLIENWKSRLDTDLSNRKRNEFTALDHSENKKHLLFMEHEVPRWDRDGGARTTFSNMKLFLALGYKIVFFPYSLVKSMPYTNILQQLGIEVIYDSFDFEQWIVNNGMNLDAVFISRPLVPLKDLDLLRNYTHAQIIYYTMDLHYLRALRRYGLEKDEAVLKEANLLKDVEFEIVDNADIILTPSRSEKEMLLEEFPYKKIDDLPVYIFENYPGDCIDTPFDSRDNLLFLGDFNHPPNGDAVIWFINEIFPLILKKLPDVKFIVAGGDPPQDILNLASDNIVIAGHLDDLVPYFEQARVFVAPIRYGAGIKGKIVTSLSHCLPAVTTSIGNEGLNLLDGKDIYIADDAAGFADQVIKLYLDRAIWESMAVRGLKFVKDNFSKEYGLAKLRKIIEPGNADVNEI